MVAIGGTKANCRFNRKLLTTRNVNDAINLQRNVSSILNASINIFKTNGDKLRIINFNVIDI